MIKIRIRCTSPEKTLSRLVLSHLDFSHPEKRDGELVIYVSVLHFRAAREVFSSLGLKYKACPVGFLGLLYRYRHRWGIAVGIFIAVFLFYLSTFFVWSVKIEGNRSVDDEEILETLAARGFFEGVKKSSVDVNEVSLGFLSDRSEFSFCSININGAVAHVQVAERTPTRYAESESEPYNLVADADGVVVRVEILNGQAMVKTGDVVHKGQILASGVIENTVNTAFRLRRAEGRVYARCDRELEFSCDIETVEKRYVDEEEISRFYILGRGIGLKNFPDGEFDVSTRVEKFEIFSRELPVGLEKTLFSFFEEKEVVLTEEEALRRAHDKYRAWCSTELDGAVIENEEFSHRIENGKLILVCKVSAIEDITTRSKIEIG